jgi:hypothetical protein
MASEHAPIEAIIARIRSGAQDAVDKGQPDTHQSHRADELLALCELADLAHEFAAGGDYLDGGGVIRCAYCYQSIEHHAPECPTFRTRALLGPDEPTGPQMVDVPPLGVPGSRELGTATLNTKDSNARFRLTYLGDGDTRLQGGDAWVDEPEGDDLDWPDPVVLGTVRATVTGTTIRPVYPVADEGTLGTFDPALYNHEGD